MPILITNTKSHWRELVGNRAVVSLPTPPTDRPTDRNCFWRLRSNRHIRRSRASTFSASRMLRQTTRICRKIFFKLHSSGTASRWAWQLGRWVVRWCNRSERAFSLLVLSTARVFISCITHACASYANETFLICCCWFCSFYSSFLFWICFCVASSLLLLHFSCSSINFFFSHKIILLNFTLNVIFI